MVQGDGLITFQASFKGIHQMVSFTNKNISKMSKCYFHKYPSYDLIYDFFSKDVLY